jgi:hypothetical protein
MYGQEDPGGESIIVMWSLEEAFNAALMTGTGELMPGIILPSIKPELSFIL